MSYVGTIHAYRSKFQASHKPVPTRKTVNNWVKNYWVSTTTHKKRKRKNSSNSQKHSKGERIVPEKSDSIDREALICLTTKVYNSQKNFFPELKRKRMFSSTWFQQDGVTMHTSNKTLEVLHSAFSRRIISCGSGCTLRGCHDQWTPPHLISSCGDI